MFDLLYAIATIFNYGLTALIVIAFFALIVLIMLVIDSPPLKNETNTVPPSDPYFDEIEEFRNDFK